MKKIIAFMIFILLLQSVAAINLDVKKISSEEVLIMGLNKPAVINLEVKNRGEGGNFLFYTFFGSGMYPKGTVFINKGETKEVEVGIYPREDSQQRGFVTFGYFIKAPDSSEQEESLTIKIIDLKDAFEIGSAEFNTEKNSIKIYIKNLVNFNFGDVHAKFSSSFFNVEKDFQLDSKEREEFDIQLNREDFKKLSAGFYTLKTEVEVGGEKANIEGMITFPENSLITTTEKKSGFIITTDVIRKTNEGNIVSPSETVIKKNILSRLFTGFSIQPDLVERRGVNVYYTWAKEIKPGETLEVIAKTNWIFPLLTIFFVVAIVLLVKQFSKTSLVLRKKVSFVKAKGGEFALKVTVFVTARKYVERVTVTDRLPALVKLHERFGAEQPKRIDEKNRKIEWLFEKLEAGETRVVSYIVYSKVGVLGRFALPSAFAVYEKDGEIKEAESNRAFFITEQRSPKGD